MPAPVRKPGTNINTLTPVFLLLVAIPLSTLMWIGNIAFTILKPGPDGMFLIFFFFLSV